MTNYNLPMTFRAISLPGYYTSRSAKSPDSHHEITPIYVDICPPIVSVEKKRKPAEQKVTLRTFIFHLYCFL